MTDTTLPPPGTLVEMTVTGETPLRGVRVVAAADAVVTLSLAAADVPAAGATVALRWPAGARGRYVVDGLVVTVDEHRAEVQLSDAPAIEQQRSFVRGGGGEHVLLHRPGREDALGWIRDISEQGVRAHFADVDLAPGDRFQLRIQLDRDIVDVAAVAAKVGKLRQQVPQRGPMSVEVVAVLSSDETQAQLIRRYVLRQQLLARARTG
ncbi:MAG TPA: PilZ domain-containing protein [Actinoplanes sp.]|nr:PilZ domain-containing protein [Actinoplanes sp.]